MVEALPRSRSGRLRLEIEGVNLKDLGGMFGKSSPFCDVSKKVNGRWQSIARTETIKKKLNPKFSNQPEFKYEDISE